MVQKAGQARVRKTGHKEVHAGVRGELVVDPFLGPGIMNRLMAGQIVKYNPYENDTFVLQNGWPIHKAAYVLLSSVAGKSCVTYLRH